MIINADFVNQHCHKKLGYYDVDKMKIHEAEEIFINFEMNVLNNLYIYKEIVEKCLPNNLRKLELDDSIFLDEKTVNNLPKTLEELNLKESSGKINVSLPNLRKIIGKGIKLIGNFDKLEEAKVRKISQIPYTLKKLNVYKYNNHSRNIEELKIKYFKGGKFGEKLKILKIIICKNLIEDEIFEKFNNLSELDIYDAKNIKKIDFLKNCNNLKKLKIWSGNQDILDYLPKKLEDLDFNTGLNFYNKEKSSYKELSNLPCSLKKVRLCNIYSNLDFLPPIEELELYHFYGTFFNLPNSLKRINLYWN